MATKSVDQNINVSSIDSSWKLVAVSYDQIAKEANFYVDGQYFQFKNVTFPAVMGNLTVGSRQNSTGTTSPGFVGYVDNLFVYADVLTANDLDFLRTSKRLQAAGISTASAGSALKVQNGIGMVVVTSGLIASQLSTFSRMTIAAWVKIENDLLTFPAVIIDKSSAGHFEYKLSLLDDPIKSVRKITVLLGESLSSQENAPKKMPQNIATGASWHLQWTIDALPIDKYFQHITMSWNGVLVSLYVNGTLIGTSPWNGHITDFNCAVHLGQPADMLDGRDGLSVSSQARFNGQIDSLGIWNTSLSGPTIVSTYMRTPDLKNDRNLVVYFPFDEGYGLKTSSAIGTFQGIFNPVFDVITGSCANENWVLSTAPIDDTITTLEDIPVIVKLNASDPLSTVLLFNITAAPSHGLLYSLGDATIMHSSGSVFPVIGNKIDPLRPFKDSRLLYIPTSDFNGLDSFSFTAFSASDYSRFSQLPATINLQVLPLVDPSELQVFDGSVTLHPFLVTDVDAWETSSLLDVQARVTYSTQYGVQLLSGHPQVPESGTSAVVVDHNVSLTLASTQGLSFSDSTALGRGSNDAAVRFKASVFDANNAVAALTVNLPRQTLTSPVNATLSVQVGDQPQLDSDAIASYNASLTLPLMVQFSSLPYILDVAPRVVSTYGGASIDITAKYFSQDVLFCLISDSVVRVSRLSGSLMRCTVPVLSQGSHSVSVMTSAGLVSNPLNINVLPALIPVSASPNVGGVLGGTVVTVQLATDATSGPTSVYCSFGGVIVPATVKSLGTVLCTAPAFELASSSVNLVSGVKVDLSVAVNTEEFYFSVQFTYVRTAVVYWLAPAYVLAHTGFEWVAVRGSGLLPTARCKLNSFPCESKFVSDTTLMCRTPMLNELDPATTQLTLSLANDGVTYVDTGISLTVAPRPVVALVTPSYSVTLTDTMITVLGSGFDQSFSLRCFFISAAQVEPMSSQAVITSTSLLRCPVPRGLSAASYVLTVSTTADLSAPPSNTRSNVFDVYDAPLIERIYPNVAAEGVFSGVAGAGTGVTVTVVGRGFFSAGAEKCVWLSANTAPGDTPKPILSVPARIVAANVAQCALPVSLSTLDVVRSEVLAPGEYYLQISWNGQDFNTSAVTQTSSSVVQTLFTVFCAPNVTSVFPSHGPSVGGTPLTLKGTNFLNVSDIKCEFGDVSNMSAVAAAVIRTRAKLVDSSTIVCASPRRATALLNAPLTVPLNIAYGSQSVPVGFNYTYDLPVSIMSVSPVFGLISGGDAVTVKGLNFAAYSEASCVFVISASATVSTIAPSYVSVPAVVLSASTVTCVTPPLVVGKARLYVSLNGLNELESGIGQEGYIGSVGTNSFVLYNFVKPAQVSGVLPAVVSGGVETVVTLAGFNFRPSMNRLRCVLVMHPTDGESVVSSSTQPISVDVNAVACRVKVATSSTTTVLIGVSNNGVSVDSMVQLTVHSPLQPFAVSPQFIPSSGTRSFSVRFGPASDLTDLADSPCVCVLNGTITVSGSVKSDTIGNFVQCDLSATSTPQGLYLVDVQFGAASFVNTTLLRVYSYAPLLPVSIGPRRLSTGTSTNVTLSWSDGDPSKSSGDISDLPPGLSTVWGKISSTGEAVQCSVQATESDRKVICEVPSPVSPVIFSLLVSFNALHYHTIAVLEAVRPYTLFDLSPLSLPVGLTSILNIAGSDFRSTSTYSCSFLPHPTAVVPTAVAQTAQIREIELESTSCSFVSSSLVQCVFDAAGAMPGTGTMQCAIDSQNISAPFELFKPSVIASVRPSAIFPGDAVTVTVDSSLSVNYCVFTAVSTVQRQIVAASVLNKTTISCSTAQSSFTGSMSIDLSVNGRDVTGTSSLLTFVQKPVVDSVYPSFGPVSGNTVVHIYGSGLSVSGLMCQFGNAISTMAVFSDSHVSCVTPQQSAVSVAVLSFSVNGEQFSSTGFVFRYVAEPILWSLSPALGPEIGGTRVYLQGANLGPRSGVLCQFGSTGPPVSARWESDDLVSCVTPAMMPGLVDVRLSTNGQQFSSSSISFSFYSMSSVSTLRPSFGFVSGGTDVYVVGIGFVDSPSLSCKFGLTLVPGLFLSSEEILCRSPLSLSVSEVFVEVANNGIDFTASDVSFAYRALVSVDTVVPVRVPNTGGSVINVTLSPNNNNISQFLCAISGSVISTSVISNTVVQCVIPLLPVPSEHQPSTLSLQLVAANGADVVWQRDIPMYSPPALHSVFPNVVTERGGVDIYITGTGFFPSAHILCSYKSSGDSFMHSVAITGQFLSETVLSCPVPSLKPGHYSLATTFNNVDYDYSSTLSLVVSPQLTVENVTPLVMFAGDTVDVRVSGTGIGDSESPLCILGHKIKTSVPTYVRDQTSLVCHVPPQLPGTIPVDITFNGRDVTGTSSLLTFVQKPVVDSVYPSFGPVSGNTVVHIYGSGLSVSGLMCQFGNAISTMAVFSDSHVSCVTPQQSAVSVAVLSFSVNGEQFSSTGFVFRYVAEPILWSLSPALGPEIGGTRVYLQGANLGPRSGVLCQFGSTGPPVSARWESDDLVSCVTPAMMPGLVDVRLSTNGQQFSSSSISFTYYSREQLVSSTPAVCPAYGSLTVSVTGSGFLNTSSLACMFGGISVGATYVSATELTCRCPPKVTSSRSMLTAAASSSVSLSISVNGLDFVSNQLPFSYYDNVIVQAVSPVAGSYVGGTLVTVTVSGQPLTARDDVQCVFGSVGVAPGVVSLTGPRVTTVSCSSPVFIHPNGNLFHSFPEGTVPLSLLVNSNPSISATGFTYVDMPASSSLSVYPLSGSEVGGWNVIITFPVTKALVGSYTCRFNSTLVVPGTKLGARVDCRVPRMSFGTALLEVSYDSLNYMQVTSLSLTSAISVSSASPLYGPIQGNQTILLVGTGFNVGFYRNSNSASNSSNRSDFDICCEFDGRLTRASYVNASVISCVSPPHIVGAVSLIVQQCSAPVRVAYSNSSTSSSVSQAFTYEYVDRDVVYSIAPSIGFVAGGVKIRIVGSGFQSTSVYTCTFTLDALSVVVSADFKSDRVLYCTTPAVERSAIASIDVSVNSTVTLFNTWFGFYSVPVFDSIFPAFGADSGGTEVILRSANLSAFWDPSCRFGEAVETRDNSSEAVETGDNSSARNVVSAAVSIGADGVWLLSCSSPSSSVGSVSLYVSPYASAAYIPTRLNFSYVPVPTVSRLEPVLVGANVAPGSSSSSLGPLTLYGSNMNTSSIFCCTFSEGGGEVIVGNVVDDTRATCSLPTIWHHLAQGFESSVSVSTNCKDYIDTGLKVVKVISIPEVVAVPEGGHAAGGTTVILTGSGLGSGGTGTVYCSFSSIALNWKVTVPATVIDPSRASCISPVFPLQYNASNSFVNNSLSPASASAFGLFVASSGNIGRVETTLTVSTDAGLSYSSTAGLGTFTYVATPNVISVGPAALDNSTFIMLVTGAGFQAISSRWGVERTICRVGMHTVPGRVMREDTVACLVSGVTVGVYRVAVSMNGQDFVSSSSAVLRVIPPLVVQNVSPSKIFELSIQSQDTQNVTIAVTADTDTIAVLGSAALFCTVNGTSFPAILSAADFIYAEITCKLSGPLRAANYVVNVGTGSKSSLLAEDARLTVLSMPAVFSSASGSSMITSGVQTDVSLFGNFSSAYVTESGLSVFSCAFKVVASSPSGTAALAPVVFSPELSEQRSGLIQNTVLTTSTQPSFSNSSVVVCTFDGASVNVPTRLLTRGAHYLFLGLSLQGSVRYVSAMALVVAPSISVFSPNVTVYGYNTVLSISGNNLRQTPKLACRVGAQLFPASLVAEGTVQCVISVDREGSYRVSLTLDGHSFVSPQSGAVLTSVAPVRELALTRSTVNCPTDGSLTGFTLTGYGFLAFKNLLSCQVGHSSSPPVSLTDSVLVCACPALQSVTGPYSTIVSKGSKSRMSVAFNITMTNIVSPLAQGSIAYYTAPQIRISTKRIMVGRSTQVNVTFIKGAADISNDEYLRVGRNASCRLTLESSLESSDTVLLPQYVSAVGDNVLVCGLLVPDSLAPSAYNSLGTDYSVSVPRAKFQVTLDGSQYFDAGSIDLVSTPLVASYSPTSGIESGGFTIDMLITNPALQDVMFCVFGAGRGNTVPIIVDKNANVYSDTAMLVRARCVAPPLPPGPLKLALLTGSVYSPAVDLVVFTRPSLISISPNALPRGTSPVPSGASITANASVLTLFMQNLAPAANSTSPFSSSSSSVSGISSSVSGISVHDLPTVPYAGLSTRFTCRVNGSAMLTVDAVVSSLSAGRNQTDGTLACDVGALALRTGTYTLEILGNNVVLGSGTFTVYAPVNVKNIHQGTVLVGQTTSLFLEVSDYPLDPVTTVALCVFEANGGGDAANSSSKLQTSIAKVINANFITCSSSPSMTSGLYMIRVSLDPVNYSRGSGKPLVLIDPVLVKHLLPVQGSINGGTHVLVTGDGFQPYAPYQCLFGRLQIPAQYVSQQSISCISPDVSNSGTGTYKVTVGVGGSSISTATHDLQFNFKAEPKIVSITPKLLSIFGDTMTIFGQNFADGNSGSVGDSQSPLPAWCMFGNNIVVGTVVSPVLIQCRAPMLQRSFSTDQYGLNSTVRVSVNSVDFYPALGTSTTRSDLVEIAAAEFTYSATVAIGSVRPWHGPSTGGTVLTISGQNFPDRADLTCKIGMRTAAASRVNASTLKCVVPSSGPTGNDVDVGTDVSVSVQYGLVSVPSTIVFHFDGLHSISSVAPARVTSFNAPGAFVTILGSGFMNYDDLQCRIGGESRPALFTSYVSVNCLLPAVLTPGVLSVSVTLNGEDFISGSSSYLVVQSELLLLSISPVFGPALGYTSLALTVSGLTYGEAYLCVIGGLTVNASLDSTFGTLRCLTPPLLTGGVSNQSSVDSNTAPVVVVNSAQTETSSVVYAPSFRYTSQLVVAGITPYLGPIGGGTVVALKLLSPRLSAITSSASLNISCKFTPTEAANADFSVPTQAIRVDLSTNTIFCTTPPAFNTHTNAAPAPALLMSPALALNGVDFEPTSILFEYYIEPVIISADPSVVVANVDSVVMLTRGNLGVRFERHESWLCRYTSGEGELIVPTMWMGNLSLACTVNLPLGVGYISLSRNGIDWTGMTSIQSVSGARFVSIAPVAVPWNGLVSLTLAGYGFPADGDVSMQSVVVLRPLVSNPLYTRRVTASVINDTALSFTLPVWPAQSDVISVTVEYGGYISNALNLTVHPAVSIVGISPAFGLQQGLSSMKLHLSSSALPSSLEYSVIFSSNTLGSVTVVPSLIDYSNSLVRVYSPNLTQYSNWDPSSQGVGSNMTILVNVSLSASNGYVSPTAAFFYLALMQLRRIEPAVLTETGGLVRIYGSAIPRVAMVVCRFQSVQGLNSFVNASLSTENYIECLAPPSAVGNVTVRVSPNAGIDWLAVDMALQYAARAQLLGLSPPSGPLEGGTIVTVNGVALLALASGYIPFCRFGSLEVPARNLTNENLTCVTPSVSKGGSVAVSISLRHPQGRVKDTLTSQDLVFGYYEEVAVFSVQPKDGPAYGGTMLTIGGSGFVFSTALTSRFIVEGTDGSPITIDVPCTFVSSTSIRVSAPTNPLGAQVGFASLQVSNNKQDFSPSSVAFYWFSSPVAKTIYPSRVFESGGVTIDIMGDGFVPSFPNVLQCRFGGSVIVSAMFVSRQSVQCESPPALVGNVTVEVTINGQDFITAGSLLYTPFPRLISATPSKGPHRGGTIVTLATTGLEDTYDRLVAAALTRAVGVGGLGLSPTSAVQNTSTSVSLQCLFGSRTVSATMPTPTTIQCVSPTYTRNMTTTVPLSVQLLEGYSSTVLKGYEVSFRYLRDPTVISTSVLKGPASGGTNLYLWGTFEPNVGTGTTACVFSDIYTNVTFINETFVSCRSPALGYMNLTEIIPVSLQLTYNGKDNVDTGFVFEYYPVPVFTSVRPLYGPVYGGTTVVLTGKYIQYLDNKASCMFGHGARTQFEGGLREKRTGVVQATRVDHQTVECVSPASDSFIDQTVALSFSVNGVDFTPLSVGATSSYVTDVLDFTYTLGVAIYDISPEHGTIHGGTVVVVSGINFPLPNSTVDTIDSPSPWYCAFGSAAVRATVTSRYALTCVSPVSESVIPGNYSVTLVQLPGSKVDKVSLTAQVLFL